jgi:hypothetical protein
VIKLEIRQDCTHSPTIQEIICVNLCLSAFHLRLTCSIKDLCKMSNMSLRHLSKAIAKKEPAEWNSDALQT